MCVLCGGGDPRWRRRVMMAALLDVGAADEGAVAPV